MRGFTILRVPKSIPFQNHAVQRARAIECRGAAYVEAAISHNCETIFKHAMHAVAWDLPKLQCSMPDELSEACCR